MYSLRGLTRHSILFLFPKRSKSQWAPDSAAHRSFMENGLCSRQKSGGEERKKEREGGLQPAGCADSSTEVEEQTSKGFPTRRDNLEMSTVHCG